MERHFQVTNILLTPGVRTSVLLEELFLTNVRYDTRCYFNVRSKADMSQLNLLHGNNN